MRLPLRRMVEGAVAQARSVGRARGPGRALRVLRHVLGEPTCENEGELTMCESYVALLPARPDARAVEGDVVSLDLHVEYFDLPYCAAVGPVVMDMPAAASLAERMNATFPEPLSATDMW
ncbi:MAG: hypothetical protein AB8I08_34525 [Sandaracinaceae bacterium]